MARAALPPEVSVQVPPNLAPTRDLLDCGVDDLGGVSPVTDDYINPAYEWPAVAELEAVAAEADLPLRERLPVYGRYLPADLRPEAVEPASGSWLRNPVVEALRATDEAGRRYRALL
jgi:FO synthase subunit 1